jgi:hypothetical protein
MSTVAWQLRDLRRLIAMHVASFPVSIFLATARFGARELTIFGLESAAQKDVDHLEGQLRKAGLNVRVRFKLSSPSMLAGIRSIEGVSDLARNDVILYDPSQIFARTRAVADLVRALRGAAGRLITDIHVDAWRRTIYCRVRPGSGVSELKTIRLQAETLCNAWLLRVPRAFRMAVRFGEGLPEGCKLAAADARSLPALTVEAVRLKLKRRLSIGVFASAMVAYAGTALAQGAQPAGTNVTVIQKSSGTVEYTAPQAVNAPNLTTQSLTSVTGGDIWTGGGAKLSLPVGDLFGLQIEGGIGLDDYYGIGGHLFWRDPGVGLLGGVASYETLDQVDMLRLGLEAEKYIGDITLAGKLEYQAGDIKDGVLASADVSYYVTPDVALRGGAEYNPENSAAHAGAEWRPAFTQAPGLSVFADSRFDEDGFDNVMIGMKLHFGTKGATMIDRDRRADPSDLLFNVQTLDHARGY